MLFCIVTFNLWLHFNNKLLTYLLTSSHDAFKLVGFTVLCNQFILVLLILTVPLTVFVSYMLKMSTFFCVFFTCCNGCQLVPAFVYICLYLFVGFLITLIIKLLWKRAIITSFSFKIGIHECLVIVRRWSHSLGVEMQRKWVEKTPHDTTEWSNKK